MCLKRIRISACAMLLLGAWLWPAPADAARLEPGSVVSSRDVSGKPVALVAGDALNLRAEPSADGEVYVKLLRGASVHVLRQGSETRIGGRSDRWSLVAVNKCPDQDCWRGLVGWVADSYLAHDDRFERLEAWRPGLVAGYSAGWAFAYDVAADGSFTRWSAPCLPGACPVRDEDVDFECPVGESRDGAFCLLTGHLYRYDDFLRGRGEDGRWLDGGSLYLRPAFLWVDEPGHLCALESERNSAARMCGGADAGPAEPAMAIAEVTADLRERLAVTTPATLNLRAEPSVEAAIVAGLLRLTVVEVIGDAGPPVAVEGVESRWVPVVVVECFGDSADPFRCGEGTVGWVADLFLAFEDRFEPVTAWRAGQLGAAVGDCSFSYTIAADASFEYLVDCGQYGSFPVQTGQLHRYRELVQAPPLDGWLSFLHADENGRLCFVPSGEVHLEYDPDGPYARCQD